MSVQKNTYLVSVAKKWLNISKRTKLTADKDEIIGIGKKMYPFLGENRQKDALEAVELFKIGLSNKEKEEILYQCVYNHCKYGVSIREALTYGFINKSHEEKKNYITHMTRYFYYNYLNDVVWARENLEDKYNAYCLMKEFYKRDIILIQSEDDYEEYCKFADKHAEYVVKPIDLGLGNGIHKDKVDASEGNRKKHFQQILSEGKFNNTEYTYGNSSSIILEELIDQGEELSLLHPASINCVRLTTLVINGKVIFYYPWIKVGVGGNFISNMGSNGFGVGINVETGICETNGFDEFGNICEFHPDTNVKFKGFKIPNWQHLLEMGQELALKFASKVKYIGWDMAYTKNGWSVLEANPEAEFVEQFMYQKGTKNELEKLIGWDSSKDIMSLVK